MILLVVERINIINIVNIINYFVLPFILTVNDIVSKNKVLIKNIQIFIAF